MAVLNLRGVNDGLAAFLKAEASMAGLPLREYCIAILEMRGQLGLTWGRLEQWQQERQREEGNNGKEKVAEVAAEKTGKAGQENRAAGKQSRNVGGEKVGAARAQEAETVRAAKMERMDKLVDMVREEQRVRPYPDDPIETDAVGTTGCDVTVSKPMAGRPAHAGNCTCFTCKPPKEK